MTGRALLLVLASLGVPALASSPGCAPRPVACDPAGPCGGGHGLECVASRCRGADGGLSDLSKSRRLVLAPLAVSFIQRGSSAPPGALPSAVRLGRSGEDSTAVLLRFDIPEGLEVLEAYLLIDRAEGGDARVSDGVGVRLHAERVVSAWSPATVAWNGGPELVDPRAASLVVRRGAPTTLRVPATAVVVGARQAGEPPDRGVALRADGSTEQGLAIALAPSMSSPAAGDPDQAETPAVRGPRLELYVK